MRAIRRAAFVWYYFIFSAPLSRLYLVTVDLLIRLGWLAGAKRLLAFEAARIKRDVATLTRLRTEAQP